MSPSCYGKTALDYAWENKTPKGTDVYWALDPERVSEGKVVQLNFTGTLADGTVLDTSEGGQPLEFLYGVGRLIPGLEAGLEGLKVGDKNRISVAAADAYGDRDESALQEVPRDQFPEDMALEVGMPLSAQTERGMMYATVMEERLSALEAKRGKWLAASASSCSASLGADGGDQAPVPQARVHLRRRLQERSGDSDQGPPAPTATP